MGVAEVQGGAAKEIGEQQGLLMTIPGIPKCCSKIQIKSYGMDTSINVRVMMPTDIMFLPSYRPHRHQSIDEAMIAFKGRNTIKQCMPKKPMKQGFKLWVRANATNVYVSQFKFYTGEQGSNAEFGLGGNVVTRLFGDLVGKYYHVFMDNFLDMKKG